MKSVGFGLLLAIFCAAGVTARLGWTQEPGTAASAPSRVFAGTAAVGNAPQAVAPQSAVLTTTFEEALPSPAGIPAGRSPARFSRPADPPGPPIAPAQQPSVKVAGAEWSPPQNLRQRRVTRMVPTVGLETVELSPEEIEANQSFQNAVKTLRSSTEEETRNKAKDTMHSALEKQFDIDFARREKELAEVEQRVRKLRDQLEKRKAARDRIVELRLQTLVNETEGLGFPDTRVSEGSDPFFFGTASDAALLFDTSPFDQQIKSEPAIIAPSPPEIKY